MIYWTLIPKDFSNPIGSVYMSTKIITNFFTKVMKSLTLFSYQKQSNYFYKIIEILFNVYIKLEIKFENKPMSKKYTSESLS